MTTICVVILLGIATCHAALVDERQEMDVTVRIRFIDEAERAARVRRQVEDRAANSAIQTALERFRNLFNRGRNNDDSDSDESDESVSVLDSSFLKESSLFESTFDGSDESVSVLDSSLLEESSLFESTFETDDYYYSEDFSSSEGSGSEPTNTPAPPKPAGKEAKELELNIGLSDGSDIKITVAKRKKLTPNITSSVIRNGKLEIDTTQTAQKELSVFADEEAGTFVLLSCGEVCETAAAMLGETAIFALEPAGANPYSGKGKIVSQKKEPVLADVRVLGVGSDGQPLDIPVTFRKKRDLLLSQQMKESMRTRKRRQTVEGNVVELIIIADYSEYLYWLERASSDAAAAKSAMQLYYILLTNMMDLRFQDLAAQKGDKVTFMINQIIYAETPADSAWIEDNLSGDVVNVDKALDDVTEWAWPLRSSFAPHDHILVVSKRDLGTLVNGVLSSDPIGAAWTGGMCNTAYSISIIEDPGLGLVDFAATHEIGHSMASTHDSNAGCSDDDFYIMGARGGAPAEGLSASNKSSNPFMFSTCAAESIHNFISDLGSGSCLLRHTFDEANYHQFKDYFAPGVFLPIDTQCELHYGNGSRRCYTLDGTICSDGAWCWNPADPNYCYSLYVREGTLCSDNQRCHLGVCVDSNIVAPTCPPEVYSSLHAERATNDGGVIVDSGGNAGVSIIVAPSSGTPYATYQTVTAQTVESADVIC